MALDINTIIETIKKGDTDTICNWFSYVYMFNLSIFALCFVIYITKLYKGKYSIFTSILFWGILIGFSIITTIIFSTMCYQPMPKSDRLSKI